MATNTMPAHLVGTELEKTWNTIIGLATTQNVDPATQPINVETIPLEEVQGLVAVGAAELTTVDSKPMATLKFAAPPEDVSGSKAASKPHTFADTKVAANR